jgi:hypothetical protein
MVGVVWVFAILLLFQPSVLFLLREENLRTSWEICVCASGRRSERKRSVEIAESVQLLYKELSVGRVYHFQPSQNESRSQRSCGAARARLGVAQPRFFDIRFDSDSASSIDACAFQWYWIHYISHPAQVRGCDAQELD